MSAHARVLSAVLAAVLLLSTGCSLLGGKGKGQDQPSKPEPTAWQGVMRMTGPDGAVTKNMALTAFATVYGPLPGVEAAAGSREGLRSGSAALRWITAYWHEITPEQRAGVARLIGRDVPPGIKYQSDDTTSTSGATASTGSGTKGRSVAYGPLPAEAQGRAECAAPNQVDPVLEAELKDLWKQLGPKVGLGPVVHFAACKSLVPRTHQTGPSAGQPQPEAFADAWGWFHTKTGECVVTTYPAMPAAGPYRTEILVHELTHCAEGMILKDRYAAPQAPSWILEGWADWVAGKLTGHYSDAGYWQAYLTQSGGPLKDQSYEAMGFWWELDYVGVDVWGNGRKAVEASVSKGQRDDAGAFAAAIQGSEAKVLNDWPSSYLRTPDRGRAWDTAGVGITADKTNVPSLVVQPRDRQQILADGLDNVVVALDIQAEVVQFAQSKGSVYGRFGPNGGGDHLLPDAIARGTAFCTKGELCVCPPNTPGSGTPFQTIAPGKGVLAFAGGTQEANIAVTSQPLKEFCGEPKDKQPNPPPISGGGPNGAPGPGGPTSPPPTCQNCTTASTHGDPHLVTFDGAFYDLQSAGEFTLTASLDDSLLVQTRQEPLGESTSFGVNTAAAANVAGDRVGFYLKPSGIEVRVNGTTVTPGSSDGPLPDGGTLTRFGDPANPGYAVAWPDGSTLYVTRTSTEALKVDMAVPGTRKGRLNGLLGDNDGSPANDLDAGGEDILPHTDPPYAKLHGAFADHWRVKPGKSLFDYAPGESTATYTDRSFPSTRTDPATLPGYADADAQCKAAGVTGKARLDACILDVAVTGKREFAESAAAQQKFTESTAGTTPPGSGPDAELPVDPVCLREAKEGPKTLTMNVDIGETVRAGGSSGRLLCAGFIATGDWRHHLLFSSPTDRTVNVTRVGNADCRLEWTVYKAFVSDTPAVPKVSACEDIGTLTLSANTVYILVVDKPDPAVSGLYGFRISPNGT